VKKDYNVKKFHITNVQPVSVFGTMTTQMNGYDAMPNLFLCDHLLLTFLTLFLKFYVIS